MTLTITTEKGQIELSSSFRIPQKVKNEIQRVLRLIIDETSPIEKLLDKIKEMDPIADTPRGSIKAYLHSRRWTQTDLSKKTKIPQGHISDIINGKRPIGLTRAKKLGEAFGVDFKKFL